MAIPWRACFVAAALAGTLLAGCSSPTTTPQASNTSLTRHLAFAFEDLSALDHPATGSLEERMARYTTVAFEYTHAGAPLDVATTTVHFQTTGGLQRTAPLSSFTAKTQITDHETVRIAPANMALTSGLSLDNAGQTFASRAGADRDWFTAGGQPLPIASTEVGSAAWGLHASGGVSLHAHNLAFTTPGDMVCDNTGCHTPVMDNRLDAFAFDYNNTVDASVAARTTRPAGATQVAFELTSLTDHMDLAASASGLAGNESFDASVKGQVTAKLSGHVDFIFNALRDLATTGAAGDLTVDGTIATTGLPGAPIPPTVHDTEHFPYTTQPANIGNLADPTLAAFLKRMWAMDLVVGDDFAFSMHGVVGNITYSTQVLGAESRTVGSAARPTFRLADHFKATLPGSLFPSEHTQDFSFDFTYWIDQASYLPLYEQGSVTQTFKAADFPQMRDAFSAAMTRTGGHLLSFPDDAALSIRTDASMEMTAYSGDYAHAALLTAGAARLVPVLAVLTETAGLMGGL